MRNLLIIILTIFSLLISGKFCSADEKTTISSSYPNLLNTYDSINLKTWGTLPSCRTTTIYLDDAYGFKYCGEGSSGSSFWSESHNLIYPSSLTQNVVIGSDAEGPRKNVPLLILGKDPSDPAATEFNSIALTPSDNLSNATLSFYNETTPTNTRNNAGYIDFHIGDSRANFDYDARIMNSYEPTPTGLKGLGIYLREFSSNPALFITIDHAVGIGTSAPYKGPLPDSSDDARMDVNGDMEMDKIYLKKGNPVDGDHIAELKVKYDNSVLGKEGYYAVYAPPE